MRSATMSTTYSQHFPNKSIVISFNLNLLLKLLLKSLFTCYYFHREAVCRPFIGGHKFFLDSTVRLDVHLLGLLSAELSGQDAMVKSFTLKPSMILVYFKYYSFRY